MCVYVCVHVCARELPRASATEIITMWWILVSLATAQPRHIVHSYSRMWTSLETEQYGTEYIFQEEIQDNFACGKPGFIHRSWVFLTNSIYVLLSRRGAIYIYLSGPTHSWVAGTYSGLLQAGNLRSLLLWDRQTLDSAQGETSTAWSQEWFQWAESKAPRNWGNRTNR